MTLPQRTFDIEQDWYVLCVFFWFLPATVDASASFYSFICCSYTHLQYTQMIPFSNCHLSPFLSFFTAGCNLAGTWINRFLCNQEIDCRNSGENTKDCFGNISKWIMFEAEWCWWWCPKSQLDRLDNSASQRESSSFLTSNSMKMKPWVPSIYTTLWTVYINYLG